MNKPNNILLNVPRSLETVLVQRLPKVPFAIQYEFSFCEQCVDRLVKNLLLTKPPQVVQSMPTRCSREHN